ncbi:MAG TPA: DUF2269 domain-containing protein [Gammaproteobacteria bacterium]
MQAARISRFSRRLLLAVHLAATAGVFGLDLALVALGIAGRAGATAAAVYPAAHLIGAWVLSPFAVVSLGSGVALGVLTEWGLLRYWWVTLKLAITAALTAAVLLVLVPRLGVQASAALEASAGAVQPQEPLALVLAPIVAVALLTVAMLLAVFKPAWRLR